jgi:hypothetical protein
MNPLASHWLRLSLWLFAASPVIALAVTLATSAPLDLVLILTLAMWAIVCVILALLALAGMAVRLFGRGMRALRR